MFLDEAREYLGSFRERVQEDTNTYLKDLIVKLEELKFSEEIFSGVNCIVSSSRLKDILRSFNSFILFSPLDYKFSHY